MIAEFGFPFGGNRLRNGKIWISQTKWNFQISNLSSHESVDAISKVGV